MRITRTRSGISDPSFAVILVVATLGFLIISFGFISIIQTDQSKIGTAPADGTTITITSTAFQQSTTSTTSGVNPWSPAAHMNVNRSFSAVATLQNGSVLVAGGFAGAVANSSLASAEMYNPGTNIWKMVAPMHVGRAGALAVALNNGEVLVTGGLGNSGTLASCELYNPATNTWTMTGNMTQARFDHQIVLLNNGSVFVVGGDFGGNENNVTEVYHPSTGTWTTAAPQPVPRADMIAVKLPNGNVLVAAGHTAKGPILLSEIYNPTTNTWTQTGSLNTPHGDGGGVLLKDGDVLIAGGYTTYNDSDPTDQYLYTAELFNTTTNTWSMTGDMNLARGELGLSIVVLKNGDVLVSGGNYQSETGQITAELYNPTAGTWSLAGTMSVPRGSGAMAVLLNSGDVLAFGGLLPHACTFCGNTKGGQDLATNSADLFNPSAVATSTTTTSSSSAIPAGAQVKMPSGVGGSQQLNFIPENITVVIGVNNTVTWTNADTALHTVTSKIIPTGATSFDSGSMAAGAVFTYTFTTPGYYTYYCQFHSWMVGSVTVVAK